jgi:hypothetical protein
MFISLIHFCWAFCFPWSDATELTSKVVSFGVLGATPNVTAFAGSDEGKLIGGS